MLPEAAVVPPQSAFNVQVDPSYSINAQVDSDLQALTQPLYVVIDELISASVQTKSLWSKRPQWSDVVEIEPHNLP